MVETRETLLIRTVVEDDASGPLRRIGQEVDELGREGSRDLEKVERASKKFGTSATSSFRKVASEQDKLVKGLGKLGIKAAAVFAAYRAGLAGARAATRQGLGLVEAASDFEETFAKFEVVFGQFTLATTARLTAFGQTANRSVADLAGFASSLQDTFVPFGFAREQAADLSVGLTQLAVDVASFNNKADADVIRDFQSALVGNTETVRKYGIVAQQTQIQQEALNLGLSDGSSELDQQAKLLATLSLIIKGSSDAIGDAERTADSFANTIKGLQAGIKGLKIAFGRELQAEILGVIENLGGLDGTLEVIQVALGAVTGISKIAINAVGSLAEALQAVVKELGGADRVAGALAGNLDAVAFASAALDVVLQGLGKTTAAFFSGLIRSSALAADRVADNLRSAFDPTADRNRSIETVQKDLEQAVQAYDDFLERIKAAGGTGDAVTATAFAQLGDRVANLKLELAEATARTQEDAETLSKIWGDTFDEIQVSAVESLAGIREALNQSLTSEFKGFDPFGDQIAAMISEGLVSGSQEGVSALLGLFGVATEGVGELSSKASSDLSGTAAELQALLDGIQEIYANSAAGATGLEGTRQGAVSAVEALIVNGGTVLAETLEQVGVVLQKVVDDIEPPKSVKESISGTFKQLAQQNTAEKVAARGAAQLYGGVEDALTSFTASLIRGEANLEDFGNMLLQVLIETAARAAASGILGAAVAGAAQGGRVSNLRYYAGGAYGSGRPDPRDTVPALLRPDEFVLRPEVARRYSGGQLEGFNLTGNPAYLGATESQSRRSSSRAMERSTSTPVNISHGDVNVTISMPSGGDTMNPDALAREVTAAVERGIRGADRGLVDAVRQAVRRGGR